MEDLREVGLASVSRFWVWLKMVYVEELDYSCTDIASGSSSYSLEHPQGSPI